MTISFIKRVLDYAKKTEYDDCIALNMHVKKASADNIRLKFKQEADGSCILEKEIEEEEDHDFVEEEYNHFQSPEDLEIVENLEPSIEPEELEVFSGYYDYIDCFPECHDDRMSISPSKFFFLY